MNWLQATMLGPIATVAAVIAIAAVGLLMLTGPIDVQRGPHVIFGCFNIFGASAIAAKIQAALVSPADPTSAQEIDRPAYPPVAPIADLVHANTDPYAAAVGRR
jgi:hypothetical protein